MDADDPLLTYSPRMTLLGDVEGRIKEIRRELIIQTKRMSQLQEQMDDLSMAIRELTAATDDR